MTPKASVIIPVYNAVRHLELVLAGFSRQTFTEFELIVADDGSGPAMKQLVDEFAARPSFAVKYVFQPDEGFRKCRILNSAVRMAAAGYLVFSDGDCVPTETRAAKSLVRRVTASSSNRSTVNSAEAGTADIS